MTTNSYVISRVARLYDVLSLDKKIQSTKLEGAKTIYCLDKSELLEALISTDIFGCWEDMLGELQLSFLLFLLLYSYPALEHWKYMVTFVLINC